MADTTNTTTVHTIEVVRYDDPTIITERVAVAAFIAGYTNPTRQSYGTDLRIFAGWCHDHGINLFEVKRLAKQAGIDKRISPHGLRHSFITAALDAGVPLRDVQEAASHADPRTTMRYDPARRSLDRHATYIVSTFIAGATRPA